MIWTTNGGSMTQRLGVHCCLCLMDVQGAFLSFVSMTDSEAADPGILSVLLCWVFPPVFNDPQSQADVRIAEVLTFYLFLYFLVK